MIQVTQRMQAKRAEKAIVHKVHRAKCKESNCAQSAQSDNT